MSVRNVFGGTCDLFRALEAATMVSQVEVRLALSGPFVRNAVQPCESRSANRFGTISDDRFELSAF